MTDTHTTISASFISPDGEPETATYNVSDLKSQQRCASELNLTLRQYMAISRGSCVGRPALQMGVLDVELHESELVCSCMLLHSYVADGSQFRTHFPLVGEPAFHTALVIHALQFPRASDSAMVSSRCCHLEPESDQKRHTRVSTHLLHVCFSRCIFDRKTTALLRSSSHAVHAIWIHAHSALAVRSILGPLGYDCGLQVHFQSLFAENSRHRFSVSVCHPSKHQTLCSPEPFVALLTLMFVHGLNLRPRPVDYLYNHALYSDLYYLYTSLKRYLPVRQLEQFMVDKTPPNSLHWGTRFVLLRGVSVVDTHKLARHSISKGQKGATSKLPLSVSIDDTGPDSLSNLCMHELTMRKHSIDYNTYTLDTLDYCMRDVLLAFCLQRSRFWIEQVLLCQESTATFADELVRPIGLSSESFAHFWQMQLHTAYFRAGMYAVLLTTALAHSRCSQAAQHRNVRCATR